MVRLSVYGRALNGEAFSALKRCWDIWSSRMKWVEVHRRLAEGMGLESSYEFNEHLIPADIPLSNFSMAFRIHPPDRGGSPDPKISSIEIRMQHYLVPLHVAARRESKISVWIEDLLSLVRKEDLQELYSHLPLSRKSCDPLYPTILLVSDEERTKDLMERFFQFESPPCSDVRVQQDISRAREFLRRIERAIRSGREHHRLHELLNLLFMVQSWIYLAGGHASRKVVCAEVDYFVSGRLSSLPETFPTYSYWGYVETVPSLSWPGVWGVQLSFDPYQEDTPERETFQWRTPEGTFFVSIVSLSRMGLFFSYQRIPVRDA